jgi:hypothetical protein
MSLGDYLVALAERDEVDETGRPLWAEERRNEPELPLAG